MSQINLFVPEYLTIEEGFKACALKPFIVRCCQEFKNIDQASIHNAIMKSPDEKVFGYDHSQKQVENLSLTSLWQQWLMGTLDKKILDSEMSSSLKKLFQQPMLPSILTESNVHEDRKEYATIILSPARSTTYPHIDPPLYGGGWMYLIAGQKDWTFWPPSTFVDVFDEKIKKFRLGRFQHGTIGFLHCLMNAGDFIYFPPGWIHSVRTPVKSAGIGGYITLNITERLARFASLPLAHYGLDYVESYLDPEAMSDCNAKMRWETYV